MSVEIRPRTVMILKTRKQLIGRQCWLSCMQRYYLPCVLMQREQNQKFSGMLGFEKGRWDSGRIQLCFWKLGNNLSDVMSLVLYAPLFTAVRAAATRRKSKRFRENGFWFMSVWILPNTVMFLKTRKQLIGRQCRLCCIHRYGLPCVLVEGLANKNNSETMGFESCRWELWLIESCFSKYENNLSDDNVGCVVCTVTVSRACKWNGKKIRTFHEKLGFESCRGNPG